MLSEHISRILTTQPSHLVQILFTFFFYPDPEIQTIGVYLLMSKLYSDFLKNQN